MVKVLAFPDEDHLHHCTCPNCAAKLEYTLNETYQAKHTDWTGGVEIYDFITCPACNYKIMT